MLVVALRKPDDRRQARARKFDRYWRDYDRLASMHSTPPTPRQPRMLHFRSANGYALFMAALFLLACNQRFWREAAGLSWSGSVADALFLGSLALLLLLLHACALLLIPGRLAMMTATGLLFPVAAMAAYCADNFGVVIDSAMIRNIGETDRREVLGLLSPVLFLYAFALGVLPVFLVARSRIPAAGWRTQLRQRLRLLGLTLLVAALTGAAFAPRLQTLLEQRQLHYLSVPGAAVAAAVQQLGAGRAATPATAAAPAAISARRLVRPQGAKPLLVFLVIGETARHASFQLGGYPRPTNPRLSAIGGIHYFEAIACATSTAVAVPCMLSPLGPERFTLDADPGMPNVLEELASAGVEAQWRSNNTARYEPGAGVRKIDFADSARPALCNEESCLDEILLEELEQGLEPATADRLIVLHQMGSHGPAYYLRYPPAQEIFRPACKRKDVNACPQEALRNAYDNTILYTDGLLARMIEILQRASVRYDTALLYVSDHGESLGEKGLYLHSAPYRHAPEEQKRIPLLIWLSDAYRQRYSMDMACLQERRRHPAGHEHVYHTLMGMYAMRSAQYEGSRDLLSGCRRMGGE